MSYLKYEVSTTQFCAQKFHMFKMLYGLEDIVNIILLVPCIRQKLILEA